jgi:hypothetical protein
MFCTSILANWSLVSDAEWREVNASQQEDMGSVREAYTGILSTCMSFDERFDSIPTLYLHIPSFVLSK